LKGVTPQNNVARTWALAKKHRMDRQNEADLEFLIQVGSLFVKERIAEFWPNRSDE